ncbi:unnamed protein product, partial [Ceratitis capitata]
VCTEYCLALCHAECLPIIGVGWGVFKTTVCSTVATNTNFVVHMSMTNPFTRIETTRRRTNEPTTTTRTLTTKKRTTIECRHIKHIKRDDAPPRVVAKAAAAAAAAAQLIPPSASLFR